MVKKSSIFKSFATSKLAEKNGIWVDYGDVKFLVSRAGGTNTDYLELLKAKTRPFRHQIDRGTLSAAEDDRVTREIYAEAIIKDVQVKGDDDVWVQGVPTAKGEVVPFTRGAVLTLLTDLPEMFRDLRVMANDVQKYLEAEESADLKNS
jgi:hypothetical protein